MTYLLPLPVFNDFPYSLPVYNNLYRKDVYLGTLHLPEFACLGDGYPHVLTVALYNSLLAKDKKGNLHLFKFSSASNQATGSWFRLAPAVIAEASFRPTQTWQDHLAGGGLGRNLPLNQSNFITIAKNGGNCVQ